MRTPITAAVTVGALAVTGCAQAAAPQPNRSLRVFAAASLQQVLTDIAAEHQRETGVEVQLTFAGSADLVSQLSNGAPGDVLFTADEATMAKAEQAHLIAGDRTVIATNTLVIAVAPGNPRGIHAYRDLSAPGVQLVRCAPQVPCGAAAAKVEQAAGVATKPVSEENSVTDVLGKVTSGQADAGLVYATDVARSAGRAEAVTIPEAAKVVNRYPAAQLSGAQDPEAARAFVARLASPAARAHFDKAGFGHP